MGWFNGVSLGLHNWAWFTILLVLVVLLIFIVVLIVVNKRKQNSEEDRKAEPTIYVNVGKDSAEKMENSAVTVKEEKPAETPAPQEKPAEVKEEKPAEPNEEHAEPVVVVMKDGKQEEKPAPAKAQSKSASSTAEKEETVKEKKQPEKAQPAKKEPAAKAQPAPAKKEPAAKAQPAPVKKDAKPAPAAKAAPAAKPAPAAKDQPAPAKPATKVYHISLRKSDGMWQVKAAGAEKAIKLFNTQAEAIEYCKPLAENQEANIMIHKKDGSFRKLTY